MVVLQLPRTAAGFVLDWMKVGCGGARRLCSSACDPLLYEPLFGSATVSTAIFGVVQPISVRKWTEADITDPAPLGVHGIESNQTMKR
jgi:hypothetical protein